MNSPTSDAGVRTARPNDVPAVAHVQAAVWCDAYGPLVDAEVRDAFTPAAFEPAWRQSLRNPPTPLHRLLVATEGDAVVGFAAIGPAAEAAEPTGASTDTGMGTGTDARTQRTGEIFTFGVTPPRRGTGNGSRLLNAAVDTLRAGDFQDVSMWVLANDENIRAFVSAAGLQPDGAWRDRVIAADGRTVREVRLTASLAEQDGPAIP